MIRYAVDPIESELPIMKPYLFKHYFWQPDLIAMSVNNQTREFNGCPMYGFQLSMRKLIV